MKKVNLLFIFLLFTFSIMGQSFKQKEIFLSSWSNTDSGFIQSKKLPINTYSEFYNSDNLLVKKIFYVNDSIVTIIIPTYKDTLKLTESFYNKYNNLGRIDSLFYNTENKLLVKKGFINSESKQKSNRTTYDYNDNGQMKIKQFWNNNQLKSSWLYSYNTSDSIQETIIEYYRFGKLTSKTIQRFKNKNILFEEEYLSIKDDSSQTIKKRVITKYDRDGLAIERNIRKMNNQDEVIFRFEYERPKNGSLDWSRKRIYRNGKLIFEQRKEVKYSS